MLFYAFFSLRVFFYFCFYTRFFFYKMSFHKYRPIAPKISNSNSNTQLGTTPNLQITSNPIIQVARPNIQMTARPDVSNLQMVARPYYINDNFINNFNNFDSYQYMSYGNNIFQSEFDEVFIEDNNDELVSIKF